MSKLAEEVKDFLKGLFPHYIISEEHFVKYNGHKLFFDFYIKELDLLIEVQGRQHDEFVAHFHGDREGYFLSKRRDNAKKAYCQEHGLKLVEIRDKSELNKKKFIKRALQS